MNIAMVGTGYVGLVTGTCLADSGHVVHCIDTDAPRVEQLSQGRVPVYEPGLQELVSRNAAAGRLDEPLRWSGCPADEPSEFVFTQKDRLLPQLKHQ